MIPAIISALESDGEEPTHRTSSYGLTWRGTRLRVDETLASAGVQDGDVLEIAESAGETLKRAFVSMPVGPDFENVYGFVIRPTLVTAGLHPVRAREIYKGTPEFSKVRELIQQATLSVVDISGGSSDVHVDLGGILWSEKTRILIMKHGSVPTPRVQGLEYIEYDEYEPFRRRLKRAVWQTVGAVHRYTDCYSCRNPLPTKNESIACLKCEAAYHPKCAERLVACGRCKGDDLVELAFR
jgi:hypothetical protein